MKTLLTLCFQDLANHEVLSADEEIEIGKKIFDSRKNIYNEISKQNGLEYYVEYLKNNHSKKTSNKYGKYIPFKNPTSEIDIIFDTYSMIDIHKTVVNIAKDYEFIKKHYESFINGEYSDIERRTQNHTTPITNRIKQINKEYEKCLDGINELILKNGRFLIELTRRYESNEDKILDVLNDGFFGLKRAAEGFDYRKGFKFSTYAAYYIQRSIFSKDFRNNLIYIPRGLKSKVKEFNIQLFKLMEKLNREPTNEEILEKMNIKSNQIKNLRTVSNLLDILPESIEEYGIEKNILLSVQDSKISPREVYHEKEKKQIILEAISLLSEKEQIIIKMRYGLDDNSIKTETLDTIGKRLNITREAVRQTEKKILKKLKNDPRLKNLIL